MSVVAAILAELCSRGVVVRADGETLRLKPKAALDDSLLARVKANKRDILAFLSGRPATCALSCYAIEPGKWIHHPWDGCTTVKLEAQGSRQHVQITCWHCNGLKRCGCSTCAPGGLTESGVCAACKGTGYLWRWIQ
jgi:hypothetical protein